MYTLYSPVFECFWCKVFSLLTNEIFSDNSASVSKPDCLRAAKLPIMAQSECETMYQGFSQPILDSMLCAGYRNGGVDACKGDSGGPLACLINGDCYDETFILV